MKPIFNYKNYKPFVRDLVLTYPKNGRGQYARLAKYLGVSPVVISQIFQADKELSQEQAFLVAEYFQLSELARDFLITLVHVARAGSVKLKSYYLSKLREQKKTGMSLNKRVGKTKKLGHAVSTQFYSDHIYSAARLASGLESVRSIEDLAGYLKIDYFEAKKVVHFLLEHKLIKKGKNGLAEGPPVTFVGTDSVLLNFHRRNWRLKAMSSMRVSRESDLFYSVPMVLSEELAMEIRESLTTKLSELSKQVPESSSEVTYCLNIDYFKF